MKRIAIALIAILSVFALVSCDMFGPETHKIGIYNHSTNDYDFAIFDEAGEKIIAEHTIMSGESYIFAELEAGKYQIKYEGRNEGTGYPFSGIKADIRYSDFHICKTNKGYAEGGGVACGKDHN